MISKLQHTIIRASAGAGKTYQLANRFIALLLLQALEHPVAPEKLVALTFTRKGAAEFATRILNRLAAAASSTAACARLKRDLEMIVEGDPAGNVRGLAPGVELKLNQARVRAVLAAMVDQMDRVCLGTIDSFMARSVQTLAFELGIGGFEILDEPAAEIARRDLLAEVFRHAASTDLDAFYQTIKRATLKSPASLRHQLAEITGNFHDLVCALDDPNGWGGPLFWAPSPAPVRGKGDWRQAAGRLAETLAEKNFGHKTLTKSLYSMLQWLSERDCEAGVGVPPAWLKEDSKLRAIWSNWPQGDWLVEFGRKDCTIPASVMAPLQLILQGWLMAELGALSEKTRALHNILAAYEAVYDRQARHKGRLAFSDLPLLLSHAQSDNADAAINLLALRWYQQYDHWLLDEFQDTSRAQWTVLHPWLDEAIQDDGGTKSVFVVGDIKQSIYGWRGGEPRLFEELVHFYGPAFAEQSMSESRRSRPAVLELVNLVCASNSRGLADPDRFSPLALERWRFEPHVCCEEKSSIPGYSAVLLAAPNDPAISSTDWADAESEGVGDDMLVPRARVIRSVLSRLDPLGKGLSCAILTRKGKHALAIAQWLRGHGLPNVMVEGDATLAAQSPILAAVLDALRWLDTPADGLAAGHVRFSPLWTTLAQALPQDTAAEILIGAVWRYWRERVAKTGVSSVTREWCASLLQGGLHPYSQYSLRQIDQLAYRLGAQLTLADWIFTLERFAVRETAAPGSIHAMTIHKAKGLGFDVVLLPDLDIGRHTAGKMLLRKNAHGGAMGCLLQPPNWLAAWVPELAQLKAEQEAEADLEALCILYVALTRAKEATFVIMGKEADARCSAKARNWVLQSLPSEGRDPDGTTTTQSSSEWPAGEVVWEAGDPNLTAAPEATSKLPASRPQITLPTPESPRERLTPSQAGHRTRNRPPSDGAATSRSGQDFGSQVHKVFEQIEWFFPGQPTPGPETAVRVVQGCMQVPAIRALFSRESLKDEAFRELPMEFIEHDIWWSGIIDRLVLRYSPDRTLVKAVVIDFKTDTVSSGDELKAGYIDQVEIYRRAVAASLHMEQTRVELILLSTYLRLPVMC